MIIAKIEYERRKTKRLPFSILIFFFLHVNSFAQISDTCLVACRNFTQEGKAVDISDEFVLRFGSGFITFVYHSQSPFADSLLTLSVSSGFVGQWKTENEISLPVSRQKSWAAWQMKFERSGNWSARITNEKGIILCQKNFRTLTQKDEYSPADFKASTLIFCTGINHRKPVDVKDSFSKKDERDSCWVALKVPGSLRNKTLIVDLWKRNEKDERALIRSESLIVEPEWDFASFRFALPEPGNYEMLLLTGDQIFIISGKFSVIP